MTTYDFRDIEARWQAHWDAHEPFRARNPGDPGFDPRKPKFYILDMFPYPSGAGLHVGHPIGYIATDVVARHKRMLGFNVLHPMGFDAFGLPAEQFAIETGTHPKETTDRNVATYRRQLRACGLSYDWTREIATTDPRFYKWTQWIFTQLFESWFDPRSERARPIAELVEALESGALAFDDTENLVPGNPETAAAWHARADAERRALLTTQRLARLDTIPVNWCPALGTVLANEEVTNEGRSERGNHPVFKRPLEQWVLRITAYAERLLTDLDDLDWPESVKLMQRNWIGKSTGARVVFGIDGRADGIEVFTTRPDTLFGATYVVLAPEHPLVDAVTTSERRRDVEAYRTAAAGKSDLERQSEADDKTGAFTGGFATNPVTNEHVPIWVADYVLMGYGTGAIMAVPAHDERDFAFARTFDLPLRAVVVPPLDWLRAHAPASLEDTGEPALRDAHGRTPEAFDTAFTGTGVGRNASREGLSLDGVPTEEAKARITAWLARANVGRADVQYKLRDWLFSRQRYWGEPFPILHGPESRLVSLGVDELPVTLPELADYRPVASSDPDAPPATSLSKAPESWRLVTRDGVTFRRELNTMPQWAGSCWYYLRFLDPTNDARFVDPDVERYWMQPAGVDFYLGGAEHAVLHLLYARFWHKVLFDLGHVSTKEPFGRLVNQGYILAYSYQDERGLYVNAEEVEEGENDTFTHGGRPVTRSLGKMGKSLKNSVTPDDVITRYGSDTFRLYELYLGPIDASKAWNTRAIVGVHRFLQRAWRNLVDEASGEARVTDTPPPPALRKHVHATIAAVTADVEGLRFNTAIAHLIELNNALVPLGQVPRAVAEPFVLMLAPFAPHVAEELWSRLGHAPSVSAVPWPRHDPAELVESEIEIVVQVMGKKRGSVTVPAGADAKAVQAVATADERVARHLAGKTIRKVVYVPGRLLNIVAT